MTSDLAFECLLVSQNIDLLRTMNRLLELLSIQTRVCMTAWRALELLPTSNADLIVLDWDQDADSGSELLRTIWNSTNQRKPTIMAVSAEKKPIIGAHAIIPKPVTPESAAKLLGMAYSKMLFDHRQHARYSLSVSVIATDHAKHERPVTITDIGQCGVGLRTRGELRIGDILSFDLQLPDARKAIHLQARVIWSRQDRDAHTFTSGCDLVRMPPVDAVVLDEWCRAKFKVKSPVTKAACEAISVS